MTAWPMLLAMAAAQPEQRVEAARGSPRVHASLGVGVAVGAAGYGPQGGAAIGGSIGVVLGNRYLLSAHATFATVLVFAQVAAAGVSVAFVVMDRLTLGLGIDLAYMGFLGADGGPQTSSFLFPIRASYALSGRPPLAVGRQGFALVAELAPGLRYQDRTATPSPRLQTEVAWLALLGVAYTWW